MRGVRRAARPQDPAVVTFKVYPEPGRSRLFYRVCVFPTVAKMVRYARHEGPIPRKTGRFLKGMCSTFDMYKCARRRTYRTPQLGEILLARRWCGSEVISHECTHAMFGWAVRRGLPLPERARPMAVEERYCYAQGTLVKQLVNALYAHAVLR